MRNAKKNKKPKKTGGFLRGISIESFLESPLRTSKFHGVQWISQVFPKSNLRNRLREDPDPIEGNLVPTQMSRFAFGRVGQARFKTKHAQLGDWKPPFCDPFAIRWAVVHLPKPSEPMTNCQQIARP